MAGDYIHVMEWAGELYQEPHLYLKNLWLSNQYPNNVHCDYYIIINLNPVAL